MSPHDVGGHAARWTVAEDAGWSVVALHGELDVSSAGALEEWLVDLVADGGARLRVDLSDTEFVDSSGLYALIRVKEKVEGRSGAMEFASARPIVRRALELAGLVARSPGGDGSGEPTDC